MKKENIKQLLLYSLAIIFIVIGYYNSSKGNEIIEVSARDNEETFGDVELVNTEPVEMEFKSDIVPNDEEQEQTVEDSYFEETKLQREIMYSEMICTYQDIISNDQTPEDQKSIAAQEINNITKLKNEIMVSENLIQNKGFEDVVILANNGNINVVVNTSNLLQEDIAKIQNIIEREFDVELGKINISSK